MRKSLQDQTANTMGSNSGIKRTIIPKMDMSGVNVSVNYYEHKKEVVAVKDER